MLESWIDLWPYMPYIPEVCCCFFSGMHALFSYWVLLHTSVVAHANVYLVAPCKCFCLNMPIRYAAVSPKVTGSWLWSCVCSSWNSLMLGPWYKSLSTGHVYMSQRPDCKQMGVKWSESWKYLEWQQKSWGWCECTEKRKSNWLFIWSGIGISDVHLIAFFPRKRWGFWDHRSINLKLDEWLRINLIDNIANLEFVELGGKHLKYS